MTSLSIKKIGVLNMKATGTAEIRDNQRFINFYQYKREVILRISLPTYPTKTGLTCIGDLI